ncbi:MAG: TIGR02253 family HAD-type hydrolase [Candidatus Micrarchaeia archaeon]|jgi:putative hydrolase of the HAD superfamily
MIKSIFFDIDDTLFPTSEFVELARKKALEAMIEQGVDEKYEILHERLMKIIGKKGSNYPNLFDELCGELKIKRPSRFIAAAVAAYHNTKSSISPYPEVPRLLLRLRERGYKLYVASNGDAVKQWDKLIRMGIEMYFEEVFVSEEMGERKSEHFFARAVKSVGATPKECIMVGNREDADIAPAKKAGLITIRVRRGGYSKGKTVAHYDVKNLKALEKIIGRI